RCLCRTVASHLRDAPFLFQLWSLLVPLQPAAERLDATGYPVKESISFPARGTHPREPMNGSRQRNQSVTVRTLLSVQTVCLSAQTDTVQFSQVKAFPRACVRARGNSPRRMYVSGRPCFPFVIVPRQVPPNTLFSHYLHQ